MAPGLQTLSGATGHPAQRTVMRRVLDDYVFTQKRALLVCTLLSACTAFAANGYALAVNYLSGLIEDNNLSVIYMSPALIFGIVLVRATALYFQKVETSRLAFSIMEQLQNDMYGALTLADYRDMSSNADGDFVSRLTNDITALRESLVTTANNLLRESFQLIGGLAVMLYLDWVLTLLIAILGPICVPVVARLGRTVRARAHTANEQVGSLTDFLQETISSQRMIKVFGLETYLISKASRFFQHRYALLLETVRTRSLIEPILEVVGGAALAVVFSVAGWRVVSGATELSAFLGFIVALLVASPSIRALGALSGAIQESLAALQRIFEVADLASEESLEPDAVSGSFTVTEGRIDLQHVSFGYTDDSFVLRDISMHIEPGEQIAIVGPSGGGKSTLLSLLIRLLDFSEGSIQIDGVDIRQARRTDVRGSLALVSQDVTLFDDTIGANIALGKLDATQDEIEAAAKAADAHDFITALPGGYDSPAGSKGSNLSGGQRQRISIARAILKDAPILLLDEATSALDAGAEARVQAALDRLTEGRTTLVIAHRLSTVRSADRIYVLKDGRIVESGDHDALMAQGGLYAELSALQLSGDQTPSPARPEAARDMPRNTSKSN